MTALPAMAAQSQTLYRAVGQDFFKLQHRSFIISSTILSFSFQKIAVLAVGAVGGNLA
jgi:hypothetical protein